MTGTTRGNQPPFNSTEYWKKRYRKGGTSGAGSYGRLAEYKASYINELVKTRQIDTVVEWGCGDGNQASYFNFDSYVGLDVSQRAVRSCRRKFAHKTGWEFWNVDDVKIDRFDLSMSLDVVYHLTEDDVFNAYMENLFSCSNKYVLIYSSNRNEVSAVSHVRHRKFTDWVSNNVPAWVMVDAPDNPFEFGPGKSAQTNSFAKFWLFEDVDHG